MAAASEEPSQICFTPLYGAAAGDGPALCSLLEVDDVCILLDCGWDSRFDPALLEPLRAVVPRVDLVLLSHPDLAHLGALPYAVGKLGLRAPVYATTPTHNMGQMFLYDAFLSRSADEVFETFSLDDVDAAFRKVVKLRFWQKLKLNNNKITVTPLPAGHMIGGAFWSLALETDELLYAVDCNHRKEVHLDGGVMETRQRPSLLITDAMGSEVQQEARKVSNQRLFDEVVKPTLRDGGNVLLPVDSAGRVLELLLLFDQRWQKDALQYPVIFLSSQAFNTVSFAQSQIEYSSKKILDHFNNTRSNPYEFRKVQTCHTLAEIDAAARGPCVVLASDADLNFGFAHHLLRRWAGDPRSAVLFTQRPLPGSVAARLCELPAEGERSLAIPVVARHALEGAELEAHRAAAAAAELADPGAAPGGAGGGLLEHENNDEITEALMQDIEDYESDEDEAAATAAATGLGFGAFAGPQFPMFAFQERYPARDEYGQVAELTPFMDKFARQAAGLEGSGSAADGGGGATESKERAPRRDDSKPEGQGQGQGDDEGPCKTVRSELELQVRCRVRILDYEGRSDARSLRQVLTTMRPRKCIVVHGSDEARARVKAHVESEGDECHAPAAGEPVILGSDASAYRVRIADALFADVDFETVDAYDVAYVDGVMEMDEDAGANAVPTLRPLPAEQASAHRAIALSVGELRLSELKQVLARQGLASEFKAGKLLCEAEDGAGVVTVQRNENNEITVDGPLCDEYFKVREMLFGQFSVI